MEPTRTTPASLRSIERELIDREPIFHRPEHGTSRSAFEAMTAERRRAGCELGLMRYIAFLVIGFTTASAPSEAAVPAPLGDMDPAALEYYYPPGAWKHDFIAVVALRFAVSDHGIPENIEVTRLRFAVVDEPPEEIPVSEALSGFPAETMAAADRLLRKLRFDAASAKAGLRSISIAFLVGTCDQIPHEDPVDYYLTVCRARHPAKIIVR